MLMHYHTCPTCGETIGGTEADTRAHLARQIKGNIDPQSLIICHCGQPMAVQWVNECDECKKEYEPNGDGYNGLCPLCADRGEPIEHRTGALVIQFANDSSAGNERLFSLETQRAEILNAAAASAHESRKQAERNSVFGKCPDCHTAWANEPENGCPCITWRQEAMAEEMRDARETATILAALRMWQDEAVGVMDELPYDDIASDNGTLVPLDRAEIDALCERLNQ